MKRFVVLMLAMLLIFGMVIGAKRISVGAKNFTEQFIVSNMISLLLEANGFDVRENFGMSSFAVRTALVTDQVDVYADYTGTAWMTYLKQTELVSDPNTLFEKVKEMDAENGIIWLPPADFNNTYALAVTRDFAQQHGLRTLTDLAGLINSTDENIIMGIDFEFYDRADGFFAMADAYGMNVPKNWVKTMEIGLTYEAINRGDLDVAMVFSTDGKLEKYNLVVLTDDKHFFPIYSLAVTAREDILAQYPEIVEILRPLSLYLNEKIMIRLNYLVDAEGYEPDTVAENFLNGLGLL
ncbi:MAG TPA: glycine betaine ABC transporter substrate-binding protein [Thermotogota bacterium]|nr:glycine betaine ABC transporter substrate-binding protein [Thermotogota bacterium]HRW92176.1 glycine betaine ABC transporter substrate-binding protein [Thermotogota bacterium]